MPFDPKESPHINPGPMKEGEDILSWAQNQDQDPLPQDPNLASPD